MPTIRMATVMRNMELMTSAAFLSRFLLIGMFVLP